MSNTHPIRHTIFWADDDVDDLMVFGEILESHAPDHKVIQFTNGSKLLEHLTSIPREDMPCLIILDMNMPVLGGRQTLQQLKGEPAFGHIPIVIFTTSQSPVDKEFCARHQVSMFTKPTSLLELEALIVQLTHRCAASKH